MDKSTLKYAVVSAISEELDLWLPIIPTPTSTVEILLSNIQIRSQIFCISQMQKAIRCALFRLSALSFTLKK